MTKNPANPNTIVSKADVDAYQGIDKVHFLNPEAQRLNKSLGDLAGLQHIGFHIIEVAPGKSSTELHRHYHEEECVYILEGCADAYFGTSVTPVSCGDFIGYPAGGEAHMLVNTGSSVLRCIVVGQRLAHDVVDYPRRNKRLFRHEGLAWNLVDRDDIEEPVAGRKT